MNTALYIDITFNQGVATKLNGKDFTEDGIKCVLGNVAKEYNIECSTILSNALKALENTTGKVCMKLLNGSATPYAA